MVNHIMFVHHGVPEGDEGFIHFLAIKKGPPAIFDDSSVLEVGARSKKYVRGCLLAVDYEMRLSAPGN